MAPRKAKAAVIPGPRDFFGNRIEVGDVIAVRQNLGQFTTVGRRRVVDVGPITDIVTHEHMGGGKPKRSLTTRSVFIDMREKYLRHSTPLDH